MKLHEMRLETQWHTHTHQAMSNGMWVVPIVSTTAKGFDGVHHSSSQKPWLVLEIWASESCVAKQISSGKHQNFHHTKNIAISQSATPLWGSSFVAALWIDCEWLWDARLNNQYKLSCSKTDNSSPRSPPYFLRGPWIFGLPLYSPSHVCPLALSKGCCPSWIPSPKWPGGH